MAAFKPSKPQPRYFPLKEAFERAEICQNVADTAKELAGFSDQLIALCTNRPVETGIDYERKFQKAARYKQDLETLALKALITAVTITVQLKTLDEWLELAEREIILDVFTDTGMQTMTDRLDQVSQFLLQSANEIQAAYGREANPGIPGL